jgi:type I site-specific restriction endonuclease
MDGPTKEERLAHDTMQREEIHKIRMRNSRAWNEMKDYKAPTLDDLEKMAAEKYPEHDDLIEKMMDLVSGNIENSRECQHGREILDDVIADLKQYRDTLATPEQYLEKGLL